MSKEDKWLEANSTKLLLEAKLKDLQVTSVSVVLEDIEGEPYLVLEDSDQMTVQLDPLKTLEAWNLLLPGCGSEVVWSSVICLEVLKTISFSFASVQLFNQNTVY